MATVTGLKKERSQMRRVFTMAVKKCEDSLVKKEENVKLSFKQLEDKYNRLFEIETKLKDMMLAQEELDDESMNTEFDDCERYRDTFFEIKLRYEEYIYEYHNGKEEQEVDNISVAGSSGSGGSRPKRSFKLPRIELKKFNGDPRNWLAFWGQFKKIHEDATLDGEDKFQYLLLATTEKAKTMVESFPPSGENYQEAVELLKSRFAKDNVLIQIYFRDLLNIVLSKATGKGLSLSALYDRLETQIRSLKTLNVASEKYAAMLYPLVESALPEDTLRAWERANLERLEADEDELTLLLNFIRREVEGEERLLRARTGFADGTNKVADSPKRDGSSDKVNKTRIPTATDLLSVQGSDKPQKGFCIFCSKSHSSNDCFKALKISLSDKKEMIKKSGFCFICLKGKHQAKACRNFVQCLLCNRKHYTLMCPDLPVHKSSKPGETNNSGATETLFCNNNQVLMYLQTLVVNVKIGNCVKKVRVLLDTGSMRSYITNKLASDLKLVSHGHTALKHSLFGGVESKETHNQFELTLHNSKNNGEVKVKVLGQATICNFVPTFSDETIFKELKQRNIILSDFDFNMPIDILLGTDVIPSILTGKFCNIRKELCCMETSLGWTIMGHHAVNSMSNVTISSLCLKNITRECTFWDLETIGIKDPSQELDDKKHSDSVMKNFIETVKVNDEGRYCVSLPWSTQFDRPTSNYSVAKARLESVTRRLLHSNRFVDYHKEIASWCEQGIIEKVKCTDIDKGHFLPHRPVFKTVSRTTKIRPVFDASAKDSNGNCLNKCLETGPNLLELVPSLLIKFRIGQIGLSADIRKAFLMISLNEADRNFLKFLWWSDNTRSELQIYRHTRVVFGVSSSPFLLNATINYHLKSFINSDSYKDTAEKLIRSFYVDNCISSVNTPKEYNQFMTESIDILNQGKFQLREWSHTELPNVLFQCCQSKACVNSSGLTCVSLLGVQWNCLSDTLSCQLNNINLEYQGSVSKRVILSLYQKFYDPLGLLSAVLLTPKLIMQECWRLNLNWDERIPDHLASEFRSWLEQFNADEGLEVPRCILVDSPIVDISLHTFADASKLAYGAVVYLRCQVGEVVSVKFILSKSRVCPTKRVTIPRLELIAATIGVRLSKTVVESLNITDLKRYFWTDSMVTLSWIKISKPWQTFVRNRVAEILSLSNRDEWFHVKGISNPADILSRGCTISHLTNSCWFDGPPWLRDSSDSWHISDVNSFESVSEEICNEATTTMAKVDVGCTDSWFQYFSSYTKTIRMVAWMLRFYNNISKKFVNKDSELHCQELTLAEIRLLRLVQQASVSLQKINNVETFIGEDGLLRVKTRLGFGNYSDDFKFPIILPSDHKLIISLVREVHVNNCHAGVQTTMSLLRDKFWTIGVRKLLKRVIWGCTVCVKQKSKAQTTPPAPLPAKRVDMGKVFEVTGVDLLGPLYLKGGKKTWVVLYTCAVYRAIHLELVTSLSTEGFLLTLRRFIARRGRVSTMYSDNGTNFVGCSNLFKALDWDEILRFSAISRINWVFNPPAAPWWGGWWERLVRMVKELLRRVLGKSCVSFEELQTVLCDIEVVVNTRPLTYVSDSVEDFLPLSPMHFLQDITETRTTDLDNIDSNHFKRRIRYLQKLRDDFRSRFQAEYVGNLIQHQKRFKSNSVKLKVGDVVLIENENCKRVYWPLGRVTKLVEGRDGIERVAFLKTLKGELVRPVQKLYPLELTHGEEHDGSGETIKNIYRTKRGRAVRPPQKLDL